MTRGGVVGTQMRLMARAVLHLHTEASTHAATASHVMGVPRDDAPVRRALADMQTALPPPTP